MTKVCKLAGVTSLPLCVIHHALTRETIIIVPAGRGTLSMSSSFFPLGRKKEKKTSRSSGPEISIVLIVGQPASRGALLYYLEVLL